MSDVFISYSRLDKEFVGKLRDALAEQEQDVWIDWESIPPSQAWWAEIQTGIGKANNFVVVLSPNSMASPICQMEIEYARQLGKRIIPVFHLSFDREEVVIAIAARLAAKDQDVTRKIWGDRQPHSIYDANDSELKHINYFFFKPEDDFDVRFAALMEVIRTDYKHKERHTTYELRALEWDRRQRDSGFLLVDTELTDAETWLQTVDDKQPAPTDLQLEYIHTSRAVEDRRRRLSRNLRVGTLTFAVVGVIAAVMAISSFISLQDTQAQADVAATQAADAVTAVADANNQLTAIPPTLDAVATNVKAAENFANSIQLAARAQDVFTNQQNQPLALVLAYEASLIDTAPQVDRTLSELAYRPGVHQRIVGHSDDILDVEFSPDGLTILTTSIDQTLALWDTQTGEMIREFNGHDDTVFDAVFSSDGERIVSGSIDQTLILWDVASGNIITQYGQANASILSVAISPDGDRIAAGTTGNTVLIWDVSTGEIVHRLEGHEDAVWSVAFSPNGEQVSSASRDDTLILWDVRTGTNLRRFEGHKSDVLAVDFHSDGTRIVSASSDGTLIIWNIAIESPQHTLVGHSGSVSTTAFSPDGEYIISGSTDRTLMLWDADTGEMVHHLDSYPYADRIRSVTFNGVGTQVISGSCAVSDNDAICLSGEIVIWDIISGGIVRRFEGHNNNVTSLAYDFDGSQLLSGSSDIIIYDVNTGEQVRRVEGNQTINMPIVFHSPTQQYLTISGRGVSLWHLKTGELIRSINVPADSGFQVHAASYSMDGQYILFEWPDVLLWDADNGELLQHFDGHINGASDGVFSPDGKQVLSASCAVQDENYFCYSSELVLWDVSSGGEVRRFQGHANRVDIVVFSPDGQLGASGARDNTIILWNLATGESLHQLGGHADHIRHIVFSPNGERLASSAWDDTIIIWDVNTGKMLRRFESPSGQIGSLVFSPDGSEVLAGLLDGSVISWRNDTITQLQLWVQENRYIPNLTCEQRRVYELPLC